MKYSWWDISFTFRMNVICNIKCLEYIKVQYILFSREKYLFKLSMHIYSFLHE